jgi:outer membrane receptor protein involved in Fe transport
MKRLFLLLFVFITSFSIAQKSSTLSGVVIDSLTQKPVEFANVSILDVTTNKPVNGAMCDQDGKFSISKMDRGTYQVVISFVGYGTKKILASFDKTNNLLLGSIVLSPSIKMLKEVVVEGQKTLVEEKVDRTIYNAEQDATTKGGDATDVLKRVPMLSVDADGNVSLRGSQNIKVLINNKPSTISANSVADALKQIPADMVKIVEVITSPSSKYDAEGSGGIVNIVLKKNTLDGAFLSTDVTVGNRGSNIGGNSSYRQGKMGISLGAFLRETYNVVSDFSNQQTTRVNGDTSLNLQQARLHNQGTTGTYTLGWDFDIDKNNSLTANGRYSHQDQTNFQDQLLTTTTLQNVITRQTLRDVKSTNVGNNYDASLTYTRKFAKKERELNFLGIISKNNQNNGYISNTLQPGDYSILSQNKNVNPASTQESILQVDYQEPIKEGQLIEFGGKITTRKVITDYSYYVATGDAGNYVNDPNNQSSGFNYNQSVSAGYLSYTVKAKAYTLKAGGRYEYTDINAHFNNQPNVSIPSYGTLVPSLNLSKKLKDGNLIKVSYNRRIQRPSLRDLNPNIQASNSLNATQGNPYLKPEYADTYEVSYKTNIKETTLNFSTYVRYNSNDIQPARIVRHDTIVAIAQNIGTEENYGASAFASIPVSEKFTLNGGIDLFYRILRNNVSDPILNATNSGLTPNVRVFGTYNFDNGWSLQFFSIFQGKMYNLQGYRTNPINHSVSVKKSVLAKNGSISFGLENFATPAYKVRTDLTSAYLVQNTTNTLYNFIVKASFSYKIGKIIETKKKQLVEED